MVMLLLVRVCQKLSASFDGVVTDLGGGGYILFAMLMEETFDSEHDLREATITRLPWRLSLNYLTSLHLTQGTLIISIPPCLLGYG